MKICLPSRGCLDIANDQQDIKDIMNMVATECLQNIFKGDTGSARMKCTSKT